MSTATGKVDIQLLKEKSDWVRKETLRLHLHAREARVASSLSPVEVLTVLFNGGFLRHRPAEPEWPERDVLILSKGHGTVCMYPILADRGYIGMDELEKACKEGSRLGGIPDPIVPGIETINGSLGHGAGVAAGIALAMKLRGQDRRVFCLLGDGEVNEGAIWEAIMFAGHHKLRNLTFLLDNNTKSMLDYSSEIIDLNPYAEKFAVFGYDVYDIDGHDAGAVYECYTQLLERDSEKPAFVVCNTSKGKGVPSLEASPMCHVIPVSEEELKGLINE